MPRPGPGLKAHYRFSSSRARPALALAHVLLYSAPAVSLPRRASANEYNAPEEEIMPRNSCLVAVALAAVASVAPVGAAEVSYQDLLNAGGNTRDWLSYGRTYDAQRYVPLTQITPQNVQRLH